MERIGIGILAGGKSSRMGREKAFLKLNQETFLGRILRQCRDFPEVYVSVARQTPEILEVIRGFPCRLIEDDLKEYGPVEGVYQILCAANQDYVLITATDMPFLTADFLKCLAGCIRGDENCLILRNQGKNEMLCSIYSKKLIPLMADMRMRGEHRLKYILEQTEARYIDVEELGDFGKELSNINTPREYLAIMEKSAARLE